MQQLALKLVIFSALLVFVSIGILFFVFGAIGVFYNHTLSNWNILILLSVVFVFIKLLPSIKARLKVNITKIALPERIRLMLSWLACMSLTIVMVIMLIFSIQFFKTSSSSVLHNMYLWSFREISIEVSDILIFWDNGENLSAKEEAELVVYFFELQDQESLLLSKEEKGEISKSELILLKDVREKIDAHKRQVENIIEKQLTATLKNEGIHNPLNKTSIFFPKPSFRLENPPKVLIISRRDELSEVSRIFLKYELDTKTIEKIESNADNENYVTRAFDLGGISTYPSTVRPSSAYRVISTVSHEWAHHYFFFTPMGRGTQRAIEETSAAIIGHELRDKIWEKYYSPYIEDNQANTPNNSNSSIDFNEEMRKIREQVEEYLENGEVVKAEQYMNEKRDWLEENGFYIRKLNQAYFVFKGFYATNSAYKSANGGVGEKLIELREVSANLKEFILRVSKFRSPEDLNKIYSTLKKSP